MDNSKIKITVVVNGKFHAFDYAAELNKQGKLHRLISSMPNSVARKYGITADLYVGLPIFELIKRFFRKVLKREVPALWYGKQFAKTALKYIPGDSDIVIASAGCSAEIYKSARLRGIPKILDRGSTHTLSNIKLNKLAAAYHGTEWEPHPDKFIERELIEYQLADKILVPSLFVKQSFIENGIEADKIIQIPYGLSQHKFTRLLQPAQPRQLAVLFVGQISSRKGIGVLINAVEIVRQSIPGVKLWLVGALNKNIDSAIIEKPWIKYWGVLKGQELFDKYKSASVFCLTSFEEGMALVLTEAIQCGLPIIATENTGAADIIKNGETGFVIPAGDPTIVAQKLLIILDNPGEWEIKVKTSAKKEFTWEYFCNELIGKMNQVNSTSEYLPA